MFFMPAILTINLFTSAFERQLSVDEFGFKAVSCPSAVKGRQNPYDKVKYCVQHRPILL